MHNLNLHKQGEMRVDAMRYQFFNVDAAGEDSGSSEHDCTNDMSAMMHARKLLGKDFSVEIWQGTRAVGHMGRAFGHWFLGEVIASRPNDGIEAAWH